MDNMKRPNLRIKGIEEGLEAQTKGIRNLFREIISENFPNRKRLGHPHRGDIRNTMKTRSKDFPTPHNNKND